MLSIKPPDRLDFLGDLGGAEFRNRLPDILIPKGNPGLRQRGNAYRVAIVLPCGDHNDIGFDFASIVEKCARLIEPLELWATLDLYLPIDDHRAGPDI